MFSCGIQTHYWGETRATSPVSCESGGIPAMADSHLASNKGDCYLSLLLTDYILNMYMYLVSWLLKGFCTVIQTVNPK